MSGRSEAPPPLERYGWDSGFAAAFEPHAVQGLVPGRVAVEHKNGYGLYTAAGEVTASLAGGLRHRAASSAELPAVGDWVALRLPPPGQGSAAVVAVLPRRSRFSRQQAGRAAGEQVLAANVDAVFVVSSLTGELNTRRLERYLALAWESGASPAIVLSKADLAGSLDESLARVGEVARGAPVHVISSVEGRGLDELRPYFAGDRTVALLGSSGVGKSTLINVLVGEALQEVAEVRETDGRGRHTTSRRQLVTVPGGGLIIDTPGLRELQLWEGGEGLREAFEDVEELAAACRFSTCAHESEPGCTVRAAVEAGTLPLERLRSWHKLQSELRSFEQRRDERGWAEQKRRAKVATKGLRERVRDKSEGPR
ncbi:MAG: ribosome small subunit-dependent GTPase A [Gemmatimonadota bacterium]